MAKANKAPTMSALQKTSAELLERLRRSGKGLTIAKVDFMLRTYKLDNSGRALLLKRRRELLDLSNKQFIDDTIRATGLSRATIYRSLSSHQSKRP